MRKTIALAATLIVSGAAAAQGVEVLHGWTSAGQAPALDLLKRKLAKQGVKWSDMAMAGASNSSSASSSDSPAASAAVRARVAAGNPPTAVQLQGIDITDWARQGALADLDAVASQDGWDKAVPKALQAFSKHDDKWIATPVAVHSTNWVWANRALLDRVGVIRMPNSFDEFIEAAEKVQKAGYIGLAHGGQAGQDATIFEGVALSTGGIDFYRKALIQKDKAALGSATMRQVFDNMAQLRNLIDKDHASRDEHQALALVIGEKAGFQIAGDWAKDEFLRAGKRPGLDFRCMRFPGTQGMVTFDAEQLAMFKVGAGRSAAQLKLARAVMDPAFQAAINVAAGSAPARTDVPNTAFDDCGKKAMRDLAEADARNTLVGSMAHGHAVPAPIRAAFIDVITRHFNGQIDSATAVEAMVAAVE